MHPRLGALLLLAQIAFLLTGCATAPSSPPTIASSAPPESSAAFALSSTDARDLSPLLQPIIARAGVPGAVALVLHDGRIVAQGAAGVRKKGRPELVTLADQFEICSASKSMSATLVARLIEAGKLNWDTTLVDVFGADLKPMPDAWNDVTISQLLTHRAGLTDKHLVRFLVSVIAGDTPMEQRRRFAHKMLSHEPDYPPGTKGIYASADYIIAAAALERLTGQTWEALMQEHVFLPLGITTAGFGPPGMRGRFDQPRGHGPRWLLYAPLPGARDIPIEPGGVNADYPLAAAPSGLMHMSIGDWARFVQWQLRGHATNPRAAPAGLTAASFSRLHTPSVGDLYLFPAAPTPLNNTGYAPGWFSTAKTWAKGPRADDTGRVLYHQGDNGRWNSAVWLAPELDFAVLVAFNRASTWGACDEVVSALVREFGGAR